MSITFTYGSNIITVKQPYFGYSTVINMNLHYSRVAEGYLIGDDGVGYDSRICEIPVWMLGAEDQLKVSDFFGDILQGRGNNFKMTLPPASGFFPFGADKGDAGIFTCSLIDHQKGGVIQQPYLEHTNTFKIMLVTAPSYTPVSAENEGALKVGTVTTLRPFQEMPAPSNHQNITRNVSRGGVVSSVDMGSKSDVFETEIALQMRGGNCAAVIAYLQFIRGASFVIANGANEYLFGIEHGTSGVYTVKSLTPQIKVVHDNYDRFNLSLKLVLVSAVTPLIGMELTEDDLTKEIKEEISTGELLEI